MWASLIDTRDDTIFSIDTDKVYTIDDNIIHFHINEWSKYEKILVAISIRDSLYWGDMH